MHDLVVSFNLSKRKQFVTKTESVFFSGSFIVELSEEMALKGRGAHRMWGVCFVNSFGDAKSRNRSTALHSETGIWLCCCCKVSQYTWYMWFGASQAESHLLVVTISLNKREYHLNFKAGEWMKTFVRFLKQKRL